MNTIFNYSTTAKEDVELVAKNVRPHGLLYGQLVLVPARNFATELRTPHRALNILRSKVTDGTGARNSGA